MGSERETYSRRGDWGARALRLDSPGLGRSSRGRPAWKTKFWKDCELVVGGYIPSENSREAIGALLCGEMVKGKLEYRCCVRSGYTERTKAQLYGRLKARKTAPFVNPPLAWRYRDARWVRPQLVASVRYLDRTANGRLRMSTYRGLREDG